MASLSPRETWNDNALDRLLRAWGADARLGEPLSGGNRNTVRLVTLDGRRHVLRCSQRPAAALAWELRLLERLAALGFRVPSAVPLSDGRLHADGATLFEWLDGDPPTSERAWRAVEATLWRLHSATRNYFQRPGFRSLRELLRESTGGDARLDLMPSDAIRRCRDAWRPIVDEPLSVVHGDPGASNIRISDEGVGLLDWDEARVDASILDIAALPLDRWEHYSPTRLAAARRALDGWEAANGWIVEPAYARRRLARLS